MSQQDGPGEVNHTHECSECGCPFACTCPAPFGDPALHGDQDAEVGDPWYVIAPEWRV